MLSGHSGSRGTYISFVLLRKEEILSSARAKALAKKLSAASAAYYNSDKTTMSDEEFDKLKAELQKLMPNHPFLAQVGAPLAAHLSKAKHNQPMGSLNNSNDEAEYRKWHAKHNKAVVAMWKMDGSSIGLTYENGTLVQAITRGDGFEGEDVTQNARLFKNLPSSVPGFTGSVRGEALLRLKDFQNHFKDGTNPRNVANGTVRRSTGERAEHISFVAFDMKNGGNFKTHKARLDELAKMGFEVVPHQFCKNADEAVGWHTIIAASRASLEYEIDGIVMRVNDESAFLKLGERDNRPKGGTAFKFKAMEATTILESVELSIGTDGRIVPTANLKKVHIGGVDVRRALLNNFEEVERLKVQIGDEVKVIRAGDVIPKIMGVAKAGTNRTPINVPTTCPACGGKVVKDGAHVFCRNDLCDARTERRVKKWITKRNILYIGDSLRGRLYEAGIVTKPHHLYKLSLSTLDGLVGGNAERVMEQIDKSRAAELAEFMGSLSIKFLGRREAVHMIEDGVDTLDKFLNLTEEAALALPRFSTAKAKAVAEGIQHVRPEIDALLAVGVKVNNPTASPKAPANPGKEEGELKGKSFVFTGKIEKTDEDGKRYTRDMMQDLVIERGGKAPSSVRKGVTHLVQADPSSVSNKTKKAEKLGVKIISEADFFKMLGL
jgi:DNA ligase (NAD+)